MSVIVFSHRHLSNLPSKSAVLTKNSTKEKEANRERVRVGETGTEGGREESANAELEAADVAWDEER